MLPPPGNELPVVVDPVAGSDDGLAEDGMGVGSGREGFGKGVGVRAELGAGPGAGETLPR